MKNTSQDPDYVGPTGHEKKFYKTHFRVLRTLKKKKKSTEKYEWVKIAPGRFVYKRSQNVVNTEL